MMAPQNVFDYCAQTVRRRKLKKSYFSFSRLSGVTIAVSFSESAKFHDHPSNDNKVMMRGGGA